MMLPFDLDSFPFKTGVFVVGGTVRDLLAGKTPHDFDLAIEGDYADFAARLAENTGGRVVELGRQNHAMLRVATKTCLFDITPVCGESIDHDLYLRDFTMNAMALELASGRLIDPLAGQKDLSAKTVRMVSREVFRRDPVRLLRAYRMAAFFDFDIDKKTRAAIAADVGLIRDSAAERIRDELYKIMQCDESYSYVVMMAANDLLLSVFPELAGLKQQRLLPSDPRTLFDRTLEAYKHLENLLSPAGQFRRSIGKEAFSDWDTDRPMLLKWAVLLHNLERSPVKSPADRSKKDPARDRGAGITQRICRRLRFSRRHSNTIEAIVRHHGRPAAMFDAHRKNLPIKKEFIGLFLDCGGVTPAVLLHALADFQSRNGPDDPTAVDFAGFTRMLVQRYYSQLKPRASTPSAVNGDDLIEEFGLKPSAEFRSILQRLEVERLSHRQYSREDAFKLVADLLDRKKTN